MQSLFQISLLVNDYDAAIEFYVHTLGFELLEDTHLDSLKRWVVVSPGNGAALVLARAEGASQMHAVGQQLGGRVGFFLGTDNFERDFKLFTSRGVRFVRKVDKTDYGTVAVFEDLYGNLWDLIEHAPDHPLAMKGTMKSVMGSLE
ncbi:MAG: catechol 2,3-dioxygenase-like lactoylglutathione lyase family enzyme [Patiriisocius sp.]|jgi:catechol 2,3-dioxygenase-like lactoylglutathione lyase family enzyme